MYSVITYYNVITIYKEDFMTNIKKLLQILIPGIILAIIVYLWDIFNFEYDSRLYSCMFFKGFEGAKRTYRYPI